MAAIRLTINGTLRSVEAEPDTPLLWVLRDTLNLTGTKYGCGIGQCGACTVHVDDAPTRACLTSVGTVADKAITTIEGLWRAPSSIQPKPSQPMPNQPILMALQQAWIAEQVPQCGYCQPGMLMEAAALLARTPGATDGDIDRIMGRHICRCGTYQRIRQAIHRAAAQTPQPTATTAAARTPQPTATTTAARTSQPTATTTAARARRSGGER